MRIVLTLPLLLLMAGCAGYTAKPQKLAIHGSQVGSSPSIVVRSTASSVKARTMRVVTDDGVSWLLHLTIDRFDGQAPDVTAAYAFGGLMPYVRLSSEGAREEGYIPMNPALFERFAKTGFKVDLQDGQNQLHGVDVPARAFAHFAA